MASGRNLITQDKLNKLNINGEFHPPNTPPKPQTHTCTQTHTVYKLALVAQRETIPYFSHHYPYQTLSQIHTEGP